MRIHIIDKDCVIIDTPSGSLHVSIDSRLQTQIYLNDHFKVQVTGMHKHYPRVVIDSEEYPTNLVVQKSEGEWNSLEVEGGV